MINSREYVDRLRSQAKQLNELADSLEDEFGLQGSGRPPDPPPRLPAAELAPVARAMFSLRRKREKFVPNKFLGEPVWDLLLHLFDRTASNQPVSITKASYAANVPPTTALRAITLMENEGYLIRNKPRVDSRNVQLLLTTSAMEAMGTYLQASDPPQLYTKALLHRNGED